MSILFEPMKIKSMELRNRFVRSATSDACADEAGHVTDKQIKLFADLAAGGIGLIITGITSVHPAGKISPVQASIAHDDCIPGLKRLTATVHEREAKIAVQLFHAGRESVHFLKTQNKQAKGVSFVGDDLYFNEEYNSFTEDEIREIIQAYGDAAKRARDTGFDAVQLHGAHAYLPSQFLSPYTNRREDDWGGSLENRLRFHREIYKDIKAKAGQDYPVLVKLGVQDGFPGGLEFSEGLQAAQLLAQWGYDSLEISQGLRGKGYETTEFRTGINKVGKEAYFRDWCKTIKDHVEVPVMMVGGLRSFELMEEIVQKNEADFVSLCRPFIRQPSIVYEWQSGKRDRATCISCNGCLIAIKKGERVRCIQDETEKKRSM